MRISIDEARNVARLYQAEGEVSIDLASVTPPTTDAVTLTDDAELVKEVLAEVKAQPDIRDERVTELKAAYESGQYTVDAKAVADAIVRRALADRIK
ncbi:MAG: flagellar biosynthesis anti-sigma factor FlgM [Armatimonadetes bacterium]|nr:flagellar biosynthesis anti-sigma factor FlgM [Armatimonadota bacterium]